MMQNEFCEVTITDENGVTFTRPAYTCGHCSNVVIMRADRTRPRTWCHGCWHWICETTDLCGSKCTPLHAMASDHFENAGNHAKYVRAIMAGADSIEGATRSGLITP